MSAAHLIDWITLRTPVDALGVELAARMRENFGYLTRVSPDGEILWTKPLVDFDALRSDSEGLFWQLQGSKDGKTYLAIGASPASLEHDGLNVFGGCCIKDAAEKLLVVAGRALRAILPGRSAWQCRRVDVTANYALPDGLAVDFALHQLMRSDGTRRKASNRTGNTVYWAPTSPLRRGKAYNKGRHLRMKAKKGAQIPEELLALADRLLRLELTLGGRYFRDMERAGRDWSTITGKELAAEHVRFFEQLNAVCEVEDMEREQIIEALMQVNGITEARARSAYRMYADIRRSGAIAIQAETPRATWYRNWGYLRAAGFTDAHLKGAHEVPFRRVKILVASPVASWDAVRLAA